MSSARPDSNSYASLKDIAELQRLDERISPEHKANCCSRTCFSWVGKVIKAGQKKAIEEEDLYALRGGDEVGLVSKKFEDALYAAKRNNEKSPVRKAIVQTFRRPFLVSGFIKYCNSTIQFAPPILLNQLLKVLSDLQLPPQLRTRENYEGYIFASVLFLTICLRTLVENQYFQAVVRLGFRLRSAITAAVYRKSLRLSPVARQDVPIGKRFPSLPVFYATKLALAWSRFHRELDAS